jgi:hypothetical protein
MLMKIGALILSILGAVFSVLLAMKWLGDAREYQQLIGAAASLGVDTSEIASLVRAGYALFGTGVLAIAGGVMTLRGKGKIGAALLLVAAIAPAIFTAKTLLATFLLPIAALLAFLSKPKAAQAPMAAKTPSVAPAE